jgi:Protein of unknown function (DUF3311)
MSGSSKASDNGNAQQPFTTFRKPSLGALLCALVPFAALCFSVPLWDRIHPMLLGLPFNFVWLLFGIVTTPLCMWAAYRIEVRRSSGDKAE